MVTYLADTNIFIRLFVQDNPSQSRFVEKIIQEARSGKLKITVLSEVLPEIEYVLRKVYKVERKTIFSHLNGLISTPYINIEKRSVWKKAIEIYLKNNIDIVDAVLFVESQERKNKILSFDSQNI